MGREVKIIFKSHMPEDEIEALAKCFLPDILDFFESEEGRQEFEQWKKEQSNKDTSRTTEVQAQNPYLHLFFNYADSSK